MTGLKDLFRRKSKKDLRDDPPVTPTGSPGSRPPSSAARSQTPNSPPKPPPVPTSPITPTQSRIRGSQGGTPVHQSNTKLMAGSLAVPYDQLPPGAKPEQGAYPMHGNGASVFPTNQSPIQSRNGGSISNSYGPALGVVGTPVPDRTSVPPGTAITSYDSYPDVQENGSRASAYSDTSQYSNEPNAKRFFQGDNIPPVPKTNDVPVEFKKRIMTGTPTTDKQYVNHDRVISSSSVASSHRTPIADEFAAPTWYNQRGSPPIPEFSHLHPQVNLKSSGSTEFQDVADGRETREAYSHTPALEAVGGEESGATQVGTSSVKQGRMAQPANMNGTSGFTQRRVEQDSLPIRGTADRVIQPNGNNTEPLRPRKVSIPRKSLDKPLPTPAVPQRAEDLSTAHVRQGRDLPVKKEHATPVNPMTTAHGLEQTPEIPTAIPYSTGIQSVNSPTQQNSNQSVIRSGRQTVYNREYMIENSPTPLSLEGIVDLTNSVHTTTHVHFAPAVIHETIIPRVHHIREEQVTREIHNYNIHHRTLPVVDVQVLPAKHIARSSDAVDGEWIEIPAELVPGRHRQNWVIAETVSQIPGVLDRVAQGARQFTARTFTGTEGDYKEYVSSTGVPTTETTWVHPPTISHDARLRGITLPLDMD